MATILVVDDDAEMRDALATWLGTEHEVRLAVGVPDALRQLERARPDVVISDYEMPPFLGEDLLEEIAIRWPRVGRILHTGTPSHGLGGGAAIAHQVLAKGCGLTAISAAVRACLA